MSTGDISSVTIRDDGWSADVVISGFTTGASYNYGLGANNDPTTAKVVFDVTSLGYDSSGNATTIHRTVYGVKTVRLPYPDSTVGIYANDEVSDGNLTFRMCLSDYIYSKDNTGIGNSGTAVTVTISEGLVTNDGGLGQTNNLAENFVVTNNSNVVYPKVIGHFASEQRKPVNGLQTIEVFCAHKYGQNNTPVARVDITATGATSEHSESGSATSMTLSSRSDLVPVYAVELDLSISAGFTRGELVNINFTAYPLIGDSNSILDSNIDCVKIITGTVSGSFLYGEIITQETTGATAVINQPKNASPIVVIRTNGTPNNSNTWNGTGGGINYISCGSG